MALSLGKTIGELQSTITRREYNVWVQYRAKYGPVNPVRMYDRGPALVSSAVLNVHGNKTSMKDFMPYGRKIQEVIIDNDALVSELMKRQGTRIGR